MTIHHSYIKPRLEQMIAFLTSEAGIRLSAFLGVLALMTCWELLAPRRVYSVSRPKRWLSNLGLVAFNTVAVRLLVPLTAVGAAMLAAERGWGLLNNLALPTPLEFILAVVALDLIVYLQHVMFHAVPALWRLHLVHHADLDFDVTTGLRFHTLEIVLSMVLKIAAVAALGPSPWAVVGFEVLLNATSMFNHGNVAIPLAVDRVLRLFVVTPDMHRVHHSIEPRETNSNFGFYLSWWDYLLGTYRAQPAAGHQEMTIGLKQLREEKTTNRLLRMLALPFTAQTGHYSMQSSDDVPLIPPSQSHGNSDE
jgi:sterol desaturase/sphingolipid hydroxylase (fatty acid hydroxylase superfamily)